MTYVEALALCLNRRAQNAVSELARIQSTPGLTDKQIRDAVDIAFPFMLDCMKDMVPSDAEHLLSMNRNSLHDFGREIRKPAGGSVKMEGRKSA